MRPAQGWIPAPASTRAGSPISRGQAFAGMTSAGWPRTLGMLSVILAQELPRPFPTETDTPSGVWYCRQSKVLVVYSMKDVQATHRGDSDPGRDSNRDHQFTAIKKES